MRPGIATNYTPKRSAATDDELIREEKTGNQIYRKRRQKEKNWSESCLAIIVWSRMNKREKRGNWRAIKGGAVNYCWLLLAFTTSSCYSGPTMPARHYFTPPAPQSPHSPAPSLAFLPRLPQLPSFVAKPGLDTLDSREFLKPGSMANFQHLSS